MKPILYQTNTSLPGKTRDRMDRCRKRHGKSTRAPITRAAIDFFLGLPDDKQKYWLDKVEADMKREREV